MEFSYRKRHVIPRDFGDRPRVRRISRILPVVLEEVVTGGGKRKVKRKPGIVQ